MLDFLVHEGGVEETDIVLEVGAGVGFLTERLLRGAGRVVSVEIDRALYGIAAERLGDARNLTLLNCDALEGGRWHPRVEAALAGCVSAQPSSALKMCSNLPYSAATAVVRAVLLGGFGFARCTFTVQWEVAERLTAEPGGRRYGYISALAALLADVRIVRKLPPTVFWPRPKVESAIVEMLPSAEKRSLACDPNRLAEGLSMLFSSRRKQVLGLLKRLDFDESTILRVRSLLEKSGISARERVFRLEPDVLREIVRLIRP